MEQKEKIAHKREDTNDVQTIYEHSVKTAELALRRTILLFTAD